MPGILLGPGGDGGKVPGQALAIDVAQKHLGVGNGSVGAQRVGHAMETERHLIQIPFKLKAGGIDERLVLRVVRHLGSVKMGVAA